jgi:hypothetical protein
LACSGKLPYYNQAKREYLLKLDEAMPNVSFDGLRFIEELYKEKSASAMLAH